MTGTSINSHAQAVETAQTNTLFPLDQALVPSISTTRPDSEQPTQAIINPARINQLTHETRCISFPALSLASFKSDFKEWSGSLDEDVAMNSARSTPVKDEKVTSGPYWNFVEKREEAGASLQMK